MEFFRDTLDGTLYYVIVILSIVNIFAIIGFILERKKLESDEKSRLAYVNDGIEPESMKSQVEDKILNDNNIDTNNDNFVNLDNNVNEIDSNTIENSTTNDNVIVFTDPE